MSTLTMEAPLTAFLPDLPKDEFLTPSQWTTLFSIADTFIPSIKDIHSLSDRQHAKERLTSSKSPSASTEAVEKLLEENPSSTPKFRRNLERTLVQFIPKQNSKGLKFILGALETQTGCFLLTGSRTPFHKQPFQIRHDIVTSWRSSYLPLLRSLQKSLALLCCKTWLVSSDSLTEVIGLPRFPENSKREPGFDFDFVDFPAGEIEATLDFDAIIVGSGCGGGVTAKNLSEGGLRVLVVDKGYHFPTTHFPMDVADGGEQLFESGGAVLSDDNSISTIAGGVFGGGGLVNWSASFHTQGYVREEWSKQGLSFFASQEYQNCLDTVAKRMGVSTEHINHSSGNKYLLEGSRRLGYTGTAVPQNTGNQTHDCGYCSFGCASAAKQGPAVSFLPDAAGAGAKFMQGFKVDRITFDETSGTKKATGVTGTWTSQDRSITRQVRISAKRVIVSAGTLNSPLVLLRSGLSNPQIGRNLHLHPVIGLWARYDEETRPWEGGILTSVVRDFENLDGHGHGVKLEVPSMMTWASKLLPEPIDVAKNTVVAAFEPWKSGLDYKLAASSFNHWTSVIVLCRDKDTGRVYPDPDDGRTRMAYTASAFDTNHILRGVIAAAKVMHVMGAREIGSPTPLQLNWVRSDDLKEIENGKNVNDISFEYWLDELRKHGVAAPYPSTMCSAHQMGTCRMAANAREGVVDSSGKVWGSEGLYVADASVFPSASGVNPMLTTMGICEWISRGIVRDWTKGKENGSRKI